MIEIVLCEGFPPDGVRCSRTGPNKHGGASLTDDVVVDCEVGRLAPMVPLTSRRLGSRDPGPAAPIIYAILFTRSASSHVQFDHSTSSINRVRGLASFR
jgi:hypothetical protein